MKYVSSTIAALVLVSLAAPAHAINLTGRWSGLFVCKWHYVDGRAGVTKFPTRLLDIIQDGNLLIVDENADQDYDYTGFVVYDGKNPDTRGHVALASCATTANIALGTGAEIANLKAIAKAGSGKGALHGTSIMTFPFPDGEVDECKWTFRRIDTALPAFDTLCGQ